METTMGVRLGAVIRGERERRGWLQKELAERAGVKQPTLSDVERGRVAWPNADFRRRVAAAFGWDQLRLLVAAGEVSEDEAGLNDDGQSPTVEAALGALNDDLAAHLAALAMRVDLDLREGLRSQAEFVKGQQDMRDRARRRAPVALRRAAEG
jgi:transcriptional regulator with XRE-family HTH domain